MKRAAIYVRYVEEVDPPCMDPETQKTLAIDLLKKLGVNEYHVYVDIVDTEYVDCPEFDCMMKSIAVDAYDMVIVYEFGSLATYCVDLQDVVDRILSHCKVIYSNSGLSICGPMHAGGSVETRLLVS